MVEECQVGCVEDTMRMNCNKENDCILDNHMVVMIIEATVPLVI